MGNVNMEARQIHYRGGNKPMNVEEAIKEAGSSYELPVASAETLGCVKVGVGLTINSETGVLSANSQIVNYSTTEQATGQKWIDDKDIYSKVVNFESPVSIANNDWYISNIDASDVATIINASCQTADGAYCPLVGAVDSGHFIFLACRVDSAFAAKSIILFYTKATT